MPQACLSVLLRRGEGGLHHLDRVVEAWPLDARYVLKEVRPGVGPCWLGLQSDGAFLGRMSEPFPLAPDPVPGREEV